MERPLRIGTRGSPLALAQAHMVAEALRSAHGWPEHMVEIVPITTTGDVIQDRPLAEIGGKALWTKELDRCLIEGSTDISVHSMKDVETLRPDSVAIMAMLPRADVRDRLIGAPRIDALPPRARVGTSSPRRTAQLLARRPDLDVVPIRGNVATRLAKVERGDVDATLLAAAGLDRLGLKAGVTIEVGEMLPAPAQGAIGIEGRTGDDRIHGLIAPIDDRATHACVAVERRLLEIVAGDCKSPVAALALFQGRRIRLAAELLTADGSEISRGDILFEPDDHDAPARIGESLLGQASPALRSLFGR